MVRGAGETGCRVGALKAVGEARGAYILIV